MAQVLHNTTTRITGAFLLGVDQLDRLDTAIEEQISTLDSLRRSQIERQVADGLNKWLESEKSRIADWKRRHLLKSEDSDLPSDTDRSDALRRIEERVALSYPLCVFENQLTVRFKSGRKIIAKSFDEITAQQTVVDELPTGFRWKIRVGEIEASVDLNGRELEVSAAPSADEKAGAFYIRLKDWAEAVSPPRWQRLWVSLSGAQWPIFFLSLPVAAILGLKAIPNAQVIEANKLLSSGLTNADIPKAIGLMLQLQLGNGETHYVLSWQVLAAVGMALLICIIVSIVPKSSLSIGRGKSYTQHWRFWNKLVFVSVPGFVAANFVFPFIVEKIKSIF